MLIVSCVVAIISIILLFIYCRSSLTAIVVSHFVCILAMIFVGLIYISKIVVYKSWSHADYRIYTIISKVRLSNDTLSTMYNFLVVMFMVICLLYVFMFYKKSFLLLTVCVIPIGVFAYLTDYRTMYSVYILMHTSNSYYAYFLDTYGEAICSIIFYSYLIIPSVLLFIKICTTQIFTNRRNYILSEICFMLFALFIYLVFINGYFSGIWFSNLDNFKLISGAKAVADTDVAILLIVLMLTVTFLLCFFKPFGAFTIISSSAIMENTRMRNKNLSMLLHVYKNAFVALGQQILLAKKNLNNDRTDDALYNLDFGQSIINEYMENLEKMLSLLRGNIRENGITDVIKCINKTADATENVNINKIYEDKQLLVHGENAHFIEIFTNLFLNAIEAKKNATPNIDIKVIVERPYCMVCVRDDGSGISKKDIGRIFEPFYSTKSRVRCGGIGLTYVKEIVKQYRGDIRVVSKVNEFTEFQLVFRLFNNKEGMTWRKRKLGH